MNSLPALHYANSPRCNERDRIDNMSGFLSTYISPQSSDNMVINAGSISIIIVMLSLSPHLLLINNVQSGDLVLFITFPQTLQSPSTPVHPLYLNPCTPHEMLWIVAETEKKKGRGREWRLGRDRGLDRPLHQHSMTTHIHRKIQPSLTTSHIHTI